MRLTRRMAALACASLAAIGLAPPAAAQDRTFRIGVIYDRSGPLAAGGSSLHGLGARIAIDHVIRQGPVEGHAIEAIYADAQSRPEVAVNEAVRLIEQERVDMLLGFFSSAQCVPVAGRVEQLGTFMWITGCVASAALENRNHRFVFRPAATARQFGAASADMIAAHATEKFGKPPQDLRLAIIHEDGAYGADVARGNEAGARSHGLNIVLKEAYATTAPDLSALVARLRAARPDVILHTGYSADVALFLRQARAGGLTFGALVGHGAGHGLVDTLRAAFGTDIAGFLNVEPASIWQSNPAALAPDLPPLIAMLGAAHDKEQPGRSRPAEVGIAAANTDLFLRHVLPRAIAAHGGTGPEALRKAALELDLPEGGTMPGFGVKFAAGGPLAGQNERAAPVIVEYTATGADVVWPPSLARRPPSLKLPAGHPYAAP